jgi:hypothetical protein
VRAGFQLESINLIICLLFIPRVEMITDRIACKFVVGKRHSHFSFSTNSFFTLFVNFFVDGIFRLVMKMNLATVW